MLVILHYLPYLLLAGLGLLAVIVMFGDSDSGKRSHAERLPRQHYTWKEQRPQRD